MTDPKHLDDHAWKDAEVLVERVEQAARSNRSADSFFEDLTGGLRLTIDASAVVIWFANGPTRTVLSRSGVSIHLEETPQDDWMIADHGSRSEWIDGHSQTGGRLLTRQFVDDELRLGLDLHFDHAVDLAMQRSLSELVEVILDLAATVFLRSQVIDLRRTLGHRSDRDALIGKLNEGAGLCESFAMIASAVAAETLIDRVSLVRIQGSRFRLITTSTQSSIQRRARQVRLLEQLTATVLGQGETFSFQVGSPSDVSDAASDLLDKYLHESGCREIHIESVDDKIDGDAIAAIVLERFRLPVGADQSISSLLDPIRKPVGQAILAAVQRDDAAWGTIASRVLGPTRRRKTTAIACGLCVLALAAAMIPTTLKIPTDGRVVAAKRSRLFAPAEGMVAEVTVQNGQQVHSGETLLILHSPDLDLQQRSVEGALAAARTRQNGLVALRSRGSGRSNRSQESSASADEQVLKKEIESLEEQLLLIQQQQASLTVTSPIDGRVDHWDLQQSLTARPVTHGQHLVDVISEADGWNVELDLPEKNVNYVLNEQRRQPCHCTFRLRSDPTQQHEGSISHIADVAHLDPLGKSIVRVTLPLADGAAADFRAGATVIAQIHCGQCSIGYVWMRRLIEWSRTQVWF